MDVEKFMAHVTQDEGEVRFTLDLDFTFKGVKFTSLQLFICEVDELEQAKDGEIEREDICSGDMGAHWDDKGLTDDAAGKLVDEFYDYDTAEELTLILEAELVKQAGLTAEEAEGAVETTESGMQDAGRVSYESGYIQGLVLDRLLAK